MGSMQLSVNKETEGNNVPERIETYFIRKGEAGTGGDGKDLEIIRTVSIRCLR